MAEEHILVVDDEEDILELVEYNLTRAGLRVSTAASGEEAVTAARAQLPDLVVLDLMLPGLDGLDVCRILRNDPLTASVPIIMLTAKTQEADVVTGLEVGADDYVTKPFSPRVLLARIRAVLRRQEAAPAADLETVKVRDLIVHPGRHEVLVKGKPVKLTYTEFRVLHLLARRPGWVFTRSHIVDAVRGPDHPVTERAVDVHIASRRTKLRPCLEYIETVRGVGYKVRE